MPGIINLCNLNQSWQFRIHPVDGQKFSMTLSRPTRPLMWKFKTFRYEKVERRSMYQRTLSRALKELFELKTCTRIISNKKPRIVKTGAMGESMFDLNYLTDPTNLEEIDSNIKQRKGVGNIRRVLELNEQLKQEQNSSRRDKLREELLFEASKIPNQSHKDIQSYGDHPKVVKSTPHIEHSFKVKEFSELARDLRLARTESLSPLTGHRSYYFVGDLAELEQALIKYTLSSLISRNFKVISVPDILPASLIESCGMSTQGVRSQVYFLDECHGENLCLSGTSEMSLAGLLSDSLFEDLESPVLLAAVSRCFRSEASSVTEERGIYRVHQFTKVEMFGVSKPEHSAALLNEFLAIQEQNFQSLGLGYQVLDMPMGELGAPAHRKFDIEAWLPGRQMFGEISSCSDCTSYQARRLNIKYRDQGALGFVHTVNGTACAIPRMMIALLETHQLANGNIQIPSVLLPYFSGKEELEKQRTVPKLKPNTKDKSRR